MSSVAAVKRTYSAGDFAIPQTRCSPHRIAFLESPNNHEDRPRSLKRAFLGLNSMPSGQATWEPSLLGISEDSVSENSEQKGSDEFDSSAPFTFSPSDTSGLGLAMAPISALTPLAPTPDKGNKRGGLDGNRATTDELKIDSSGQPVPPRQTETESDTAAESPRMVGSKRGRVDMNLVQSLRKGYAAYKLRKKKRHIAASGDSASASDEESVTQGMKRCLSSLAISSPARRSVQQENTPSNNMDVMVLDEQSKPLKAARKMRDTAVCSSASVSDKAYAATNGKKNFSHLVLDGGKVDLETLVPKKKKLQRSEVLDILEEALWIQHSFLTEKHAEDKADALQDQHDTFCNYNRDYNHRDMESKGRPDYFL